MSSTVARRTLDEGVALLAEDVLLEERLVYLHRLIRNLDLRREIER